MSDGTKTFDLTIEGRSFTVECSEYENEWIGEPWQAVTVYEHTNTDGELRVIEHFDGSPKADQPFDADDARQAIRMALQYQKEHSRIVWHPWPKTPLPKTEFAKPYLVTAKVKGAKGAAFVRSVYAQTGFASSYPELEVLAWAYLPTPYQPETEK